MVGARYAQHVRHEFGGDWSSGPEFPLVIFLNHLSFVGFFIVAVSITLVFLVLPGIWETWNNSRYSGCRSNFTCIYHDEHFHEVVINLSTTTLYNVDIFSSHRFSYLNTGFEVAEFFCDHLA
uniref:Uncharacterized protein n=1 Tax=Cacopsylla melanoneura TaxID=428564 RepID=A0A8D8M230_9HEMI